jgi:Uma2 family endonuclease
MAVMTMERPESEESADWHDDPHRRMDVMHALHDQLDPPEGWRVEIVEGQLVVSPAPLGKHAVIVRIIRLAAEAALPSGIGAFDNTNLEEPEGNRFIPDVAVWPITLLNTDTECVFPGDQCLLAVEVTSPHQERRDYAKAAAYARSGIPVYLLVDRKQRMCVVFTEPEGDRYRDRHEYAFGKPVTLPMEAPVTIDTSEF